jgi:putative ABC transport system permease protein
MMNMIWQDLRYGIRMLVKKPGFTVIAVITLALGIGADTAIFTVVNAALLRPLPYAQPDRLVHLWETTPQKNYPQREASYPDFLDWRQNQVFEGVAAYRGGGGMMLNSPDGSERIEAGIVTANFFSVLGVTPHLGRTFQDGEDKPGAGRVVMLSHGFWQRRFNGDPNIAGQSLLLSDNAYTVIGVLPANFQFAPRGAAEVWVPLQAAGSMATRRFMHWVNVIARLKPGVTREQGQAGMQPIAQRIAQEFNESHAGTNIILVPLHQQFVGNIKPLLLVLLVAVAFVLLIACSNVANLLLVRAAARQKEVAIRAALGASAGRLIRQLLTESLLLALIGGAVGLLLAQWGVEALIAAIPNDLLNRMPSLRGLTLDGSVLLFTVALTLAVSLLFGLAPALQIAKPELQSALKEGGKTSAGASHRGLRNLLVVAEVALALVLLVGAGLMMRSLLRLTQVDPGFNPKNLLTFTMTLPPQKYDTSEKIYAAHRQLLSTLGTAPGVKGVATINTLPLIGGNTTRFYPANQPKPAPGNDVEANLRDISANYFEVMGVRLMSGRTFNDMDTANSQGVVIINQSLAKQVFPGEDAVGQSIIEGSGPLLVVGVVADEKITGLDARTTSVVYYPYFQDSSPGPTTNVVVRTIADPMSLSNAIRSQFLAMEPGASIFFVRTMEQIAATSPATFMRRYPALLIGVFAVVALLLAAIGIYGVISYSVSQQTHEIGVRVALGARSRNIFGLVLKKGMGLALAGVAVGLAVSFALTRLMESLLFGVSATDPVTFAGIAALLMVIALVACYVPARRATRVDPMVALRYE